MSAETPDREWKKGSAELLILSLLEQQARHGYDICKLIEARSGGALKFHVTAISASVPAGESGARARALDRRAYSAPAAVLQFDFGGAKGCGSVATKLAGVCDGDRPSDGDRKCVIGSERLKSGWQVCGLSQRAKR
jgi:hypothetical protein